MKLVVLAVGHRQASWIEAGCSEYLKRMPRELTASIVHIKPEARGSKTREQILAAEARRIRDALPSPCRLVALDERGDELTTLKFAQRLEHWMQEGRTIAFVIGSADGIDEGLKCAAEDCLRLSSLTLPHGMACLLLCEQLYRASSVLKNHPYHREG
ncbi:MAG: Ribosomal RNA large subunit methyltransferase H [Betaproteobacteria bacterium ADurb.Bin341]|nr:MAG: Ribosomal RNA large subunit methyltransferase H [Betaproteobacteria bacterium ADurb.Bin341]